MISQVTETVHPEGNRLLGVCRLVPVVTVICYPFFLRAFHIAAGIPGAGRPVSIPVAALSLAAALAVPAIAFLFAWKMSAPRSLRRLAYACVLAPTLYVFLGVVTYMLKSPLPDELIWSLLWVGAAVLAVVTAQQEEKPVTHRTVGRWRVAHGIGATVVVSFVLFHVANHLFGLVGPETHAAVMGLGEVVYRARAVEPLLVAILLWQVATGGRLAWRWSSTRMDFHRTFQVASGVYLLAFVLGHMNSVFIYARTYLGIPTDWDFAIGAPTGIIHDAWNIRLLPHYLLGVFFILSHLASGVRVLLLAHGAPRSLVDRAWTGMAILSALVAIAIILAMSGLSIRMVE